MAEQSCFHSGDLVYLVNIQYGGMTGSSHSGSETAGITPSIVVTCFGSSSETSQTMIFPSAPHDAFEKAVQLAVSQIIVTTHEK